MRDDRSLPAPDVPVTLADGRRLPLSDFWRAQTLVLVFLRHFG
jgi:hypothetical protein